MKVSNKKNENSRNIKYLSGVKCKIGMCSVRIQSPINNTRNILKKKGNQKSEEDEEIKAGIN